jgi:hypothetical protein
MENPAASAREKLSVSSNIFLKNSLASIGRCGRQYAALETLSGKRLVLSIVAQ